MGGTVTPDIYRVQKEDLAVECEISEKLLMTVSIPDGTEEVDLPRFLQSQAALDKYLADLKADGCLIVDADLVSDVPDSRRDLYHGGRFTHVAGEELSRSIVANMVMLGYVQRRTGLVPEGALRDAVEAGVPKGTEELNLKALEAGMSLV